MLPTKIIFHTLFLTHNLSRKQWVYNMCARFVLETGLHGQYPSAKLLSNWEWEKHLFYSLHPVLFTYIYHWFLLCCIIVSSVEHITSMQTYIMNGQTLWYLQAFWSWTNLLVSLTTFSLFSRLSLFLLSINVASHSESENC